MGGISWIADNWIAVLNAVGVVGGLFFTAFSVRSQTKTRRIANLLTITANHREIWAELYTRPGLARVLDPSVDVAEKPVRQDEEIFVIFVILHVYTVYQTMKDGLFVKPRTLAGSFPCRFPRPLGRK